MRLPNRKPGKYTFPQFDPHMTAAKFAALKAKLEHVKKSLPRAIKETQQYGENGDFSENAEYQIAKGRLRGLNQAVIELQYQINHAIIIEPPKNDGTIQIGHTVTIATNNIKRTFQILGPTETNPPAGIISYQSPLGAALLGHKIGDSISIKLADKMIAYTIIAIQ